VLQDHREPLDLLVDLQVSLEQLGHRVLLVLLEQLELKGFKGYLVPQDLLVHLDLDQGQLVLLDLRVLLDLKVLLDLLVQQDQLAFKA